MQKVPVGTVAMMAAHMMAGIDREDFLDIYDRRGYMVQGVTVREMALDRIAQAAVDLAFSVEKKFAEAQP
jgi:hypothetical protein